MNGWHTFYNTCIVLLTLLGVFLLWELREIVLVLFIAIIFASSIRPYVDLLMNYKIHQGVAVLIIYLGVFGALIGLLVVTIPRLADFTMEIMQGGLLIRQVQEFSKSMILPVWQTFGIILPAVSVPDQLRELLNEANEAAMGQASAAARVTAQALGQLALALIMSFYWLTARQQLLGLLMRLSPMRYRERTRTIWNDVEGTLGAYVRGQAILAVIIGVASYIGLLIFRVQFALPLAVLAGLTEVVPIVGPIIGAVPAVVIAFADSPVKGLLIAGWYIVIQQLESNILVPRLMESKVGLHALLVIIAIIAGGTLNGILGAILAIPVAGALQVIAKHLLIDPVLTKQAWRPTGEGVLLEELDDTEQPPPVIQTPKGVS